MASKKKKDRRAGLPPPLRGSGIAIAVAVAVAVAIAHQTRAAARSGARTHARTHARGHFFFLHAGSWRRTLGIRHRLRPCLRLRRHRQQVPRLRAPAPTTSSHRPIFYRPHAEPARRLRAPAPGLEFQQHGATGVMPCRHLAPLHAPVLVEEHVLDLGQAPL